MFSPTKLPKKLTSKTFFTIIATQLILLASIATNVLADETSDLQYKIEKLASPLSHPWSIVIMPDGNFLVTERDGFLKRVSSSGEISANIGGLPKVVAKGQGGLLDLEIDPKFQSNNYIYFCYSDENDKGYFTALAKAKLLGNKLSNLEVIFKSNAVNSQTKHFGCRIAFDSDRSLFLSLGERGDREFAQDPLSHGGSTIWITVDGKPMAKNKNSLGWPLETFSKGHRNPQGMAINPQTKSLIVVEHGPRGGDEINITKANQNYGWPLVSQGAEYFSRMPVGEKHLDGFADPIAVWTPSIAPAGVAFYQGFEFPSLKNSLLITSLAGKMFLSYTFSQDKIIAKKIIFEKSIGRMRDVAVDTNGIIYIITDESNGALYKLTKQ